MTIRISVTHHDADSATALVAQVFQPGPAGEISDTPVRAHGVPPGATATVHLHAGDVLVVCEAGRL